MKARIMGFNRHLVHRLAPNIGALFEAYSECLSVGDGQARYCLIVVLISSKVFVNVSRCMNRDRHKAEDGLTHSSLGIPIVFWP